MAGISYVIPNPTLEKLYEGVEITRDHKADILLVIGGSVCDYAKAVSVSVNCREDLWEKHYIRFEEPECETIPVGCVLTMVGTEPELLECRCGDHEQRDEAEDRACLCS